MKKTLVALLVGASVLAATPARADHSYIGTAESKALELSVLPPGAAEDERQGLLIGYARSVVTSAPAPDEGCEADACAEATIVGPVGEPTVSVEAKDEPAEDDVVEGEIPAELSPLLDAQFGVGFVSAAPAPGARGFSSAEGANVAVNVNTLIGQLPQPIQDAVPQVVGPVTDGLNQVFEETGNAELQELGDNVTELIDTLQETLTNNPIVDISVQDSTAESQDSPENQPDLSGVTIAEATAAGANLAILPGTPVAPEGLFKVEVGQATARATTDQETAAVSSEGAIATLSVADLTTAAAGDYQEVPIESGQGEQCFGESPVLLCILVGGASETSDGASAGAVAGAVRIRAFADADPDPAQNPLPGLTLALATAEVGVNAAAPGDDPDPEPGPGTDPDDPDETPEDDLPSTGGGLMVPGIALLAIGGLGVYAMRRRRT